MRYFILIVVLFGLLIVPSAVSDEAPAKSGLNEIDPSRCETVVDNGAGVLILRIRDRKPDNLVDLSELGTWIKNWQAAHSGRRIVQISSAPTHSYFSTKDDLPGDFVVRYLPCPEEKTASQSLPYPIENVQVLYDSGMGTLLIRIKGERALLAGCASRLGNWAEDWQNKHPDRIIVGTEEAIDGRFLAYDKNLPAEFFVYYELREALANPVPKDVPQGEGDVPGGACG